MADRARPAPGPRAAGCPGRRPPSTDHGTPELQRHRLGLINGAHDPALSASLSGILLAHHVIDARQRAAADRFRQARAAAFGAVLANTDPATRREATEAEIQRNEVRYNKLINQLDVDQLSAVVDLALDLKAAWMRRQLLGLPLTGDDQAERQALLDGLDALAADSPAQASPNLSQVPGSGPIFLHPTHL